MFSAKKMKGELLLKEPVHREYGCLMAVVDDVYGLEVMRYGRRIVSARILYTDPNDLSYGYIDSDLHCTVKYGFTDDLNESDLVNILGDVTRFNIVLRGLTQFQTEKYDVVKFDVEHNDVLSRLRERVDVLKTEDKYSTYNAHVTIAYVQRGKFPYTRDNLNIKLPISRFKYSGRDGRIVYINL